MNNPAKTFLWMHLHQFQYLSLVNARETRVYKSTFSVNAQYHVRSRFCLVPVYVSHIPLGQCERSVPSQLGRIPLEPNYRFWIVYFTMWTIVRNQRRKCQFRDRYHYHATICPPGGRPALWPAADMPMASQANNSQKTNEISLSSTSPWWRNDTETFSALQSHCVGIHWWPVDSCTKGQWCKALMVSLLLVWFWTNSRVAGKRGPPNDDMTPLFCAVVPHV